MKLILFLTETQPGHTVILNFYFFFFLESGQVGGIFCKKVLILTTISNILA